jgi:DNA polymerase I
MLLSSTPSNNESVKGWIFDIYPSDLGEIAVWIIGVNGERIRLTDKFQPKIYISGTQEDIERLASSFFASQLIARWGFTFKYAHPRDTEKSRVLEVTLKDCRKTSAFSNHILKIGDYLRYEVHNCELHGDRAYLFSRDLFPLALVEVETEKSGLKYTLQDSVKNLNYAIPKLRVMELTIEVVKEGKIATFKDPIDKILLIQAEEHISIASGEEKEKLLQLTKAVKHLDPDVILTSGGDSYLFPYLIQRATLNGVLDKFILSRDDVPFVPKITGGKTFFSYGRTFYRAATIRLFGRIHIDKHNTFILNEADFEGLIEVARTCRMPLHTASRASIGSSMSSLQLYEAIKNDVLIPRNKSIPENFKSAYELLVGDRGGFVYEPEIGIHDDVGEVDFTSMYPTLMVKNNISAETILCKCCPDSRLRIPELNYHICEKRRGIVPKVLELIVSKRLSYILLKNETQDDFLREVYDKRQMALKWILVTCFGYLGYKNAKFGTIDGHIGVCTFGRETFLKAARRAETQGFTVVHGIVDSLWLKKPNVSVQKYLNLCSEISNETGVSLNFEGRYKWVVFLPSRMHPNIGVLNRYYGVMENGKLKVRGLEVRRRDTPRFIYDAQMDMIKALSQANNSKEYMEEIPNVIDVVKKARQRLLDGEVPTWDLIVTKHLSKNPKKYKQKISQVIAAEQLTREGVEVHAGKNVRFLFTHAESKWYERRVRAEQLIEKGANADTEKYLLLLYNATANLLSSAGYTPKKVYDAVRGHRIKDISNY